MDIYILDNSGNVIDMIDNYRSLIWNIQFFDTGEFELVLPASKENIEKARKGAFLCRSCDCSEHTFNNVMIVEKIEISTDYENGNTINVSGKGLKHLFARRVIWEQMTIENSTVESAILQVVLKNAIKPSDENRKFPNLTISEMKNFSETAEIQVFSEKLDEWLTEICTTYGYGWDIFIKDGKFVFDLRKGTERTYEQEENIPVVFSPEYDNLLNSTYQKNDENYANTALVGGEGEGIDQRTTSIGNSSGFNRYETYIDASSVSSNGEIITLETYYQLLQDYGKQELAKIAAVETMEGTISDSGNYEYGKDYFLGDIVQIENEYGMTATSRVTEIIFSSDENGTTITPTFGTWEV